MSLAASFLLGLAILLSVSAYLALGLPQLSSWRALAATGGFALLLLLMAVLTASVGATAPMMGVAALIAGHAGWLLGRRGRRRRSAAVNPSRLPARQRSDSARRASTKSAAASRRSSAGATSMAIAPDLPQAAVVPASEGPPVPAAAVKASPGPPPAAAATGLPMADLQRTSLGRYRIDRAIGRGSMGAVFLGLDPMLGRQVAIKTMALGQEFDGAELEEAKQRFFREAETAGRLQHRDIVTIYDVGEEQELAFIAMEFLKGHDLQRHTQPANLLPLPVVLRVGVRVAEALAYAHSQGVIHRDVKPANVMLHLPSGAVKVTDFGIARVTDASRTRTGMVLGTPSFMSPEHLAGQRVDGRTDLYSLGVMLFQLLCGQLPFQADSMAKLMYQIANDPAPDLRTLRPDLPEALALVVARALEKSPALRHADGAQLAAELRAVDAVGAGALWTGTVPNSADSGAAPADGTPKPFESTERIARDQTGHNSVP